MQNGRKNARNRSEHGRTWWCRLSDSDSRDGKIWENCHIRFRDDLGSRVVVHDRSVP